MELRHLKYFVTVVKHLNFSRAAEELNIAQPAISQQIMDLEADLGVKLLNRSKRKVALTPAGAEFLDHSQNILKKAEEARIATQRAARGEIGKLGIGFIGTACFAFLPRLVKEFREAHANIEIALIEGSPKKLSAHFLSEEINIIFSRPQRDKLASHLSYEVIYSDRLIAAVPSGHALANNTKSVSVTKLKDEPFIIYAQQEGPSLHSEIHSYCHSNGFTPNIVYEASEMQTILAMVEAEVGVALMPSSVKFLSHYGVEFLQLRPDRVRIDLDMVWDPNANNPVVEAFVELVRSRKLRIEEIFQR